MKSSSIVWWRRVGPAMSAIHAFPSLSSPASAEANAVPGGAAPALASREAGVPLGARAWPGKRGGPEGERDREGRRKRNIQPRRSEMDGRRESSRNSGALWCIAPFDNRQT